MKMRMYALPGPIKPIEDKPVINGYELEILQLRSEIDILKKQLKKERQ